MSTRNENNESVASSSRGALHSREESVIVELAETSSKLIGISAQLLAIASSHDIWNSILSKPHHGEIQSELVQVVKNTSNTLHEANTLLTKLEPIIATQDTAIIVQRFNKLEEIEVTHTLEALQQSTHDYLILSANIFNQFNDLEKPLQRILTDLIAMAGVKELGEVHAREKYLKILRKSEKRMQEKAEMHKANVKEAIRKAGKRRKSVSAMFATMKSALSSNHLLYVSPLHEIGAKWPHTGVVYNTREYYPQLLSFSRLAYTRALTYELAKISTKIDVYTVFEVVLRALEGITAAIIQWNMLVQYLSGMNSIASAVLDALTILHKRHSSGKGHGNIPSEIGMLVNEVKSMMEAYAQASSHIDSLHGLQKCIIQAESAQNDQNSSEVVFYRNFIPPDSETDFETTGTLKVTAICARDLKIGDTISQKSDPYVIIRTIKTKQQSSHARKTLNPKWGHTFQEFAFNTAWDSYFEFTVIIMDKDHTFDDYLGECKFLFTKDQLHREWTEEFTKPLESGITHKKISNISGTITISVQVEHDHKKGRLPSAALASLLEFSHNAASPVTTIMIGNPGAGKSTLLSSLVEGKILFRSGMSIGKGLTAALQAEEYNGNRYIDTPGLSDVSLRAKAAGEIERAFKQGGKFKVFFVVTLEAGRVRPDDVTTIKLVLQAATQIGPNQFSIIINKMTQEVEEVLRESTDDREELAATLVPPSVRVGTRSICYVPLNPDWSDKQDKWGKLSPELLAFIEAAPVITIDDMQSIEFIKFEEILDKLSEEIQQLREDNRALRRELAAKKLGELKCRTM